MKFGRRNRELSVDASAELAPEAAAPACTAPAGEPAPARRGTGRRIARDLGLLLLIFVVGFTIAFIWLSPGPLLASDHSTPDVVGMPGDKAEVLLGQAGFKTKRAESRQHPTYEEGTVIWQDPAAGTILPEGTPVTLTVSDGIAPYAVPDVSRLAARARGEGHRGERVPHEQGGHGAVGRARRGSWSRCGRPSARCSRRAPASSS